MSIFNRNKKKAAPGKADGKTAAKATQHSSGKAGAETSPQKVGVVSSVLPSGSDLGERTPFSDVVAKRFGPSGEPKVKPPTADAPTVAKPATKSTKSTRPSTDGAVTKMSQAPLASVETLFTSEEPELETDPMANIGRATTITGNIVAEEDLEIHGTIEGSVRLVDHQVTVGTEGLVKASVEANIVLVHGKITGDVTAADLIEVKPGGIVGGDVKAPRVIMHDGAVIVGSLDMSAALASSGDASKPEKEAAQKGERPVLKQVELPPMHATEAKADSKAKQG